MSNKLIEKRVIILCDGNYPKRATPANLLKDAQKEVKARDLAQRVLTRKNNEKGVVTEYNAICHNWKKSCLVACDGAMHSLLTKRMSADFIVGDMDTLQQCFQKKYAKKIFKESEQQTNDQSKAFRFSLGLIEEDFKSIMNILQKEVEARIELAKAKEVRKNLYNAEIETAHNVQSIEAEIAEAEKTKDKVALRALQSKLNKALAADKTAIAKAKAAKEAVAKATKVAQEATALSAAYGAKSDVRPVEETANPADDRYYDVVYKIYIVGATGGREDHSLGNISHLADYAAELPEFVAALSKIKQPKNVHLVPSADIQMVTDNGVFLPVLNSTELVGRRGDGLSIFSFDPTLKITSKGLEYKTDKVVFDMWWKATLNKFAERKVELNFNHPAKVLLYLPYRR